MKCQILFSGKITKNIDLLSTEFAHSVLSDNIVSNGYDKLLPKN